MYQSFTCADAVVNGGPQMNLPGKLIHLKNAFYLDTNNPDHFWHPVGYSTLKIIVSAQMREAVLGNVCESAVLGTMAKTAPFHFQIARTWLDAALRLL